MTDKITLLNIADLTQPITAAANINTNFATIQTAFDNTLSRDGTQPNTIGNNLDMNSFQIINLPAPATAESALRLTDLNSFVGGGTITNIPSGGNTGDALVKNSNTNYDVKWSADSSTVAAGANISVTGTSPATVATVENPNFTTSVTTPSLILGGNTMSATTGTTSFGSGGTVAYTGNPLSQFAATTSAQLAGVLSDETGTGSAVFASSPSLSSPVLTTPHISSIVNTGTLTLPTSSDTMVGRATTDTLTNKTFDTAGTGNSFKINGTQITSNTGTGANVLNSSPVIGTQLSFSPSTGGIVGTSVADSASSGIVGEVISATVLVGSAVSLSSGTPKTVTSINLSAGDWDVMGSVYFTTGGTTTVSAATAAISTTTNTIGTPGISQGATQWVIAVANAITGSTPSLYAGTYQQNVSTGTTVFLVASSTFATSTNAAYGTIWARRRR